MRSVRSYYVSPAGRRPVPAILAAAATLFAVAATITVPAAPDHANLWAVLVALFPGSAGSAFALACATSVGAVAGLAAEAFGRRDPLRPALIAAVVTALLSPATLAVPLWPALLAAAGLIAAPVRVRSGAANDNPVAADRAANPFSLAA